jgi:hypothetical protein
MVPSKRARLRYFPSGFAAVQRTAFVTSLRKLEFF